MTRTLYESAAAPMSPNARDPAKLNVICRSKPNLLNQTDLNAALLPYLKELRHNILSLRCAKQPLTLGNPKKISLVRYKNIKIGGINHKGTRMVKD